MTSYQHAAGARRSRRESPKPRRIWRWVVLGLGIALLVLVGLFAWDAYRLKDASAELKAEASAAKAAVTARDAEALQAQVTLLQDSAVEFANATTGPHWWIANHLPWISTQTRPLTQAGQSVLAIADQALTPLAATGDLSSLQVPAIVDGRIDPYVLEPYRPVLEDAAAVFEQEQADLAAVDVTGTVTAVREPFLELRSDLASLGDLIQGAHVAAELLPQMLGADSPRTYLVMVQNNAEPRTTGGIPGAILEVGVDDGRITLEGYEAASALVDMGKIPGPLTDDERRIFTERMLMFPQDVNFTPEYPRSAELMTQFWATEHAERIDGVLSVDPVALGYMLADMPPTDVLGLTITGANLSDVMLRDSYATFPDPEDQDVFFAAASQALFAQLISGGTSAVAGTEQAIEEGRFFIWSADLAEQAALATTAVAGGFLERADTVGLFLNDGSGSKIGYYIDVATTVTNHMCPDGSLRGQTVRSAYTHSYDGDVDDLPWYVSGGGVFVPAGEFHANVLLYPSADTGVTKFTVDGELGQLQPEVHDGRPMSTARIVLVPGQTVTLEYEVVANEWGLLAPGFASTPGPHSQVVDTSVDIVTDGC
jgi:hypothetical protein